MYQTNNKTNNSGHCIVIPTETNRSLLLFSCAGVYLIGWVVGWWQWHREECGSVACRLLGGTTRITPTPIHNIHHQYAHRHTKQAGRTSSSSTRSGEGERQQRYKNSSGNVVCFVASLPRFESEYFANRTTTIECSYYTSSVER